MCILPVSARPPLFKVSFLVLAVVLFSGCHRPRAKPPYSPREALRTFRLPTGFRIELVAAEPDVINPVAMAFDERGRLFVVEMPDYPFGKQNGRIKLLEDKDGDGRFETSTVFAEDLHFPNGVLPWRDGLLVSAAPDIIYIADRDGDNRAGVRQVVLTGFAALNPQVRMNGLLYGLDNWIYAAYPKFGLPSRYVKEFGDLGQPLRFTSACGISAYEGGAFPAPYARAVFVCEPVHNLVHCDVLSPAGATFLAKRAMENREFLVSTDSWFRPVFTPIGPDGALYKDFHQNSSLVPGCRRQTRLG